MSESKLIKCGKMFDGINDTLQPDMEILVEGNRISAVGKALACPEGTEMIDLTDCTVTPGDRCPCTQPVY